MMSFSRLLVIFLSFLVFSCLFVSFTFEYDPLNRCRKELIKEQSEKHSYIETNAQYGYAGTNHIARNLLKIIVYDRGTRLLSRIVCSFTMTCVMSSSRLHLSSDEWVNLRLLS